MAISKIQKWIIWITVIVIIIILGLSTFERPLVGGMGQTIGFQRTTFIYGIEIDTYSVIPKYQTFTQDKTFYVLAKQKIYLAAVVLLIGLTAVITSKKK